MLRIIGVLKQSYTTVGYRLYNDETTETIDCDTLEALELAWENGMINAHIKHATLVCDEEDYLPLIDRDTLQCIYNDKVVILGAIIYREELQGYRVTDYTGITLSLPTSEVLDFVRVGYVNAKIDTTDKKKTLVPLKGEFKEFSGLIVDPTLPYFDAVTQDPSLSLNGLLLETATHLAEAGFLYSYPTAKVTQNPEGTITCSTPLRVHKDRTSITFTITTLLDFQNRTLTLATTPPNKGNVLTVTFPSPLLDKPLATVNKTLGRGIGILLLTQTFNNHPKDRLMLKQLIADETRTAFLDKPLAMFFADQLTTHSNS